MNRGGARWVVWLVMTLSSGTWAQVGAAKVKTSPAASPTSDPPSLQARVNYETHELMADGTHRTDVWQERLVRHANKVWTQRVIPAAHVAARTEHSAAAGAHKHFDFGRAARFLQRDPQGGVQLQFVDDEHRQLVDVPQAQWSAVNFDGRYDLAAYLVPLALVRANTSSPHPVWYTQKTQGWTHRVWWSAQQQVALQIESKRDDGTRFQSVKLKLQKTEHTDHLPWDQISSYEQMTYDDFMD